MAATTIRREVVTIAAAASLSTAILVPRLGLVGVEMPAAWDAAEITIQLAQAVDGSPGLWRDLWDWTGEEITVAAAAGRVLTFDPRAAPAVEFIRARSGRSGAAITQAAARDIGLLFRSFD